MSAAVDVQNLTVTLGGKTAVDRLSCTIDKGKVTGLIGPNGAGKTTVLKAILRLLPQTHGRILLNGQDISARTAHQLHTVVSYLPQGQIAYWPLSVWQLVALARPSRTDQDVDAIETAIKAVELLPHKHDSIADLSGGERARALLARVLASDAPFIFADEPVASLDPYHQLSVMEIFKKAVTTGKTVVTVLHDLNLAAQFCDDVLLMNKGRKKAQGSVEDVMTAPLLSDVYGIKFAKTSSVSVNFPFITRV